MLAVMPAAAVRARRHFVPAAAVAAVTAMTAVTGTDSHACRDSYARCDRRDRRDLARLPLAAALA
jgi:hypothetical protein